MGIATAGDDASQRKLATSVDGHCTTLRKAEQHGSFQCWLATVKLMQPLLKVVDGCGYGVPLSGE